ncbi:sec-independent protein translocase protein TatB-like [Mustela erminea]|uniref:sec-independent protein translocase protein TatB-like n=1 Tax=Mustela erminea TaxID=36723 RepID=UPI0013873909|nr:sec-independent protein translocase protein TatB-like [Mustela erminea]
MKTPQAKTAIQTDSPRQATAPPLTEPPATAAAAAATAAAATAKAQTRPPARSLSGTETASALPAQNLPGTCPAKTGPTKAPSLPDSPSDWSYRRVGVMPAFSALTLARGLRRTRSSRRAEADYRAPE